MDTQLSEIRLTKEQAEEQLEIFRRIYSKVRLLSAEELKEENTTQAGKGENYWKESCLGAGKYCDDCVCVVALKEKARKTQLKYIGTELYEVTAQYVEVDGQSCVLEMIQNLGNGADIAQSDEIKDTKAFYEALYTDALTGAYNRRYYEDQIKKKSMHAGVAMFDLDDFKLANDTYGHDIGDAFLKTEVAVIKKMIRKTDALIRYGGDEFLLVMPGISEDFFEQKLRDIRRQICLVEMPESIGSRISASVGAVMAQGEQIRDAIARADRYMYQAKSHKNAIVTEWGTIAMDDSLPQVNAKKKKRQRILIVDDSEMNREILYEMLKDEFDILEAENGKEALEVLERYGCEISLVLLDIVMPIMDGFEVLEHMNEKDMIEDIPMDEEMLLIEQIQLFAVRERRIMIAINKYRSMKGEVSLYGFNRSESKRTFKTEEDKQLYEERIEKKISAEERLPGDMYNMQTTMENKDNMIARLEKELSTVQSKKTKAIEALAKLRLEKQKIAGESKGNEVVRAWAEAVVKAREGENKDG